MEPVEARGRRRGGNVQEIPAGLEMRPGVAGSAVRHEHGCGTQGRAGAPADVHLVTRLPGRVAARLCDRGADGAGGAVPEALAALWRFWLSRLGRIYGFAEAVHAAQAGTSGQQAEEG